MNKKISIVTAYHNRRKLFFNTLKIIEKSKFKDNVEIIVVDDASDENERIEDFTTLFNLDIKIIRIDLKNKLWMNPCIPFNIGFKEAKGDIIILQNPECLHFGDIIEYVLNNIKDNVYLNFACYATDEINGEKINNIDFNYIAYKNQIAKIITPFNNTMFSDSDNIDGLNCWYNHSIFKPRILHYCSAIMKKDLDDLGGFDERFKNGIAFDDMELVVRIQRKKMYIKTIDKPFVIHQYHTPTPYEKLYEFYKINRDLFYKIIMNETDYKLNNKMLFNKNKL